ncbi:MAG: XRE family transcriptional regulator [Hapalosiphonaceae cyanobacterium JJU2]|nr:MAG: XRE family transcriptional regulator [Hapalosiphonaceae cyanobacterium JJU2]
MDKHQEILITAIKESGLTAREIANKAGVHESTLSKFLDGKSDLKAGNYFKILSVLPSPQRQVVQESLGIVVDALSNKDNKGKGSLVQMIEIATDDEIGAAMMAIGRKWKRLRLGRIHTEDVENPIAV